MVKKNRMNRLAAVCFAAAIASVAVPGVAARAAVTPRVDLRVLVVDDGGSSVEAITAELRDTGIPYTRVDLGSGSRPVVDAAFLADTVDGRPRAKFQGVVLPNENPFGVGSAEMAALSAYETTYGIRQVDAYTWAHPGVGLEYTDNGGYSGTLDGTQAAVTAAGKAGPFAYLGGQVAFEDNSPLIPESYGFMAKPRTGYTSYLDAPVGSGRASLVGEYTHDGRSELVVTFGYNQYQQQFRLLARGIVEWVTQGVHLGQERNYFAVHVDDVFAPDARWSKELNCTPGDYACAGGEGQESTIRMTAADAQYLAQWQTSKNFKLDMLFNAGAGEEWKAENGNTDALTAQLVADRAKYRWMNHTYTHPFLGCVQDTTTTPWTCTKNSAGAINWMSRAEISAQIRDNNNWAAAKGITTDRTELVTGEHSGLRTLPQQAQDNPNLAGALADNGVKWAGSDNSREPLQRPVGAALTVPRYPMNVYYNTGTNSEMADEYNWIYTSRADGGSGICEDNPGTSTCLPDPLDANTGYLDYIVPAEARTAMRHVLNNDPRPHYVHQSNLAEERTLYPVLNQVLDGYRTLYAPSAPIVNQSMKDTGVELQRRAAWNAAIAANQVTAYRIGKDVTVKAPSGVLAPLTAPTGTKKQLLLGTADFGTAYAGTRSTWTAPELLQSAVTLHMP
ncbi:hypothetical protein [Streptomyces sp. H34-S4]|uniref:hypothetical protein n=1 Tax=Streptomyces sp. H34-S4 TaxID=2996463 RepID=UPI00227156DE|nr:hypothetical protein [Streptomyces sp. H34-S4]MCY0937918.1 hypothetical protein [Streptomyces sp. H34-S4]